MKIRKYKNHAEYLAHQCVKTDKVKAGTCQELGPLEDRLRMFICLFAQQRKFIPRGGKALCLGSRRGEEVMALRHLGLSAIGIDLVAFPPFVLEADFHCIPYADGEFDFIFTNSIDHARDPYAIAREVTRLLKPGGTVLFHLTLGMWSDEMSLGLDSSEEVIRCFEGFTILHNHRMNEYGGGLNHLLVLRKESCSSSTAQADTEK